MALNAFAFANIAPSTTDAVIVTGVTNRIILVKGAASECGATATNITFNTKPAGAGTAISMQFQNPANGGFVLPYNEGGWFQTNPGDSLSATTGTGSTTGVQIAYIMILLAGV